MPNLTTVTVTNGVPTAGSGTVSTLDNLVGTAGTGSANVVTVQGNASGTAVPVSGTVAATQSGTFTVQPGNTPNTSAWLVTESTSSQMSTAIGQSGDATGASTVVGQLKQLVANVAGSIPSGGNTIGNVVGALPAFSTGLSPSRVAAAGGSVSSDAHNLKASSGNIGAIDVFNVATYPVFLKLYNKATAPTVGTDTPVWTIPIAAGGGYSAEFRYGEFFSSGISYGITKLQADTDTTAVTAGDLTGRIKWV